MKIDEEFSAIGMNINVDTSGCMRNGVMHNVNITYINDIPVKWNQEIRHLGVNFLYKKCSCVKR